MGAMQMRKDDHQGIYEVPFGQLKRDPNYPIPVLHNLISSPAQMYYPHPPFKDTPPFDAYPPFVKV